MRLALAAVGPKPLLVADVSSTLAGMEVDAGVAAAIDLARSCAQPIDDMRGTREFRLHVTGVLTDRVLREAVGRARGGTTA